MFAGQDVGVKPVSDDIWLATFMDYDIGYFDDETCRLEPIENPFGPKVLPMSPEYLRATGFEPATPCAQKLIPAS